MRDLSIGPLVNDGLDGVLYLREPIPDSYELSEEVGEVLDVSHNEEDV